MAWHGVQHLARCAGMTCACWERRRRRRCCRRLPAPKARTSSRTSLSSAQSMYRHPLRVGVSTALVVLYTALVQCTLHAQTACPTAQWRRSLLHTLPVPRCADWQSHARVCVIEHISIAFPRWAPRGCGSPTRPSALLLLMPLGCCFALRSGPCGSSKGGGRCRMQPSRLHGVR